MPASFVRLPDATTLRRVPAWLRWLRGRVRGSEIAFLLFAILVGIGAGLGTVVIGALARTVQHVIFRLPPQLQLSGAGALHWWQLLMLPVGGAVFVLFGLAVRARGRALVDAVEANALHGARMSVTDSLIVTGQTILSNGFGASVGLEAAYAQFGGLVGAVGGRRLSLRRGDARILLGAGAGAAVAAAFGAPLAGAFYAFEVVIGAYTPSAIAPVAAAALAGAQVARGFGIVPYIVNVPPGPTILTAGYLVYAGLGAIAALFGIALMRAVAGLELLTRARLPGWASPVIGGVLLMPIAAWSPQALAAGHSAIRLDMVAGLSLWFIAGVLIAKALSVVISLGFGFRGGLFFASLFLGTLLGHLYAGLIALVAGHPVIDTGNAAMVGMAALAVGVVGAPMTMAMLVLGATGNFSLTGAVLAASLVSSTIVRTLFGYSFSTWRLHLRGETIQSARDVGWVKALTAGRMMRQGVATAPADTSIAELRRRFPLGATSRVVLHDAAGRYAGIVTLAAAYAEGVANDTPARGIGHAAHIVLTPDMDIATVMRRFDDAQCDELAVTDDQGRMLGIVTENYVRRRYAEELDKAQRALFGER